MSLTAQTIPCTCPRDCQGVSDWDRPPGTVAALLDTGDNKMLSNLTLFGFITAQTLSMGTGVEPSPERISSSELAQVETDVQSPYVEASSPEEANKILDNLEVAPGASVAKSYGPCTLTPTSVYQRTSYNKQAVGTKPVTRCSVNVTQINHSIDMRYRSAVWWNLAGTYNTGPARFSKAHESKTVAYPCVSKESTKWTSSTLGTISWGGKYYYARVYSDIRTLNCGG